MLGYSTPLTVDIPTTGSLADDVVRNADEAPDAVAFSRRTADGWEDVTAKGFLDQVRAVAKGLVASGIEPGDRVGLLSRTRYEWTLVDYAVWFAGAVTVPLYETSSAEQIEWILADSGARAVFAEDALHVDRVAEVRGGLPLLEHVWAMDSLDALVTAGREVSERRLEERRAALSPDSLATLLYTSGTTGRPKGCMLTHGNFMVEVAVALDALPELFEAEDGATLLFLPLAHVFARIIQIGAVKGRIRLGHSSQASRLLDDLQTFQPTFVLGVPRVFEKVFNTASQNAVISGKGRAFDRAADTAIAYSRALDTGHPGFAVRAYHSLYDRRVYQPLRDMLGGRCTYAISGGAPLGDRLGHFFRGVGLTVLEGYGLTETTGAITANTPELTKIGTVGRPLPGVTVRVADDGELLVKGGQVFSGYWQNDPATAEVLDADGWCHTGDLGEIDDEGFVTVTGRRKEVIVTASGKNVAPAALEDRLRAHYLVSQCMLVGDGRPFVGALVTIDPDAVAVWAEQRGKSTVVADLTDDADLFAEIESAVADANRSVSQAEGIRKFRILPVDWTEEAGQLTPSLKVRRGAVARQFQHEIERLYER
ncbi:MAG TPA: AMP-dependent synthetase/ligase [Nocardioidaceae bacterium]|nr:AMP-dependent synthetase/ligase [Nocardioidaceae bacterium]